jgi:hypothetical protein
MFAVSGMTRTVHVCTFVCRGANTEVLDTYMLKSLDAFTESDIADIHGFYRYDGEIAILYKKDLKRYKQYTTDSL